MNGRTAIELLAEALHTEPAEVPADAQLAVTPAWDSLAHTRLVLLLEERLGRPLDAMEIVSLSSLADITALLASPL